MQCNNTTTRVGNRLSSGRNSNGSDINMVVANNNNIMNEVGISGTKKMLNENRRNN